MDDVPSCKNAFTLDVCQPADTICNKTLTYFGVCLFDSETSSINQDSRQKLSKRVIRSALIGFFVKKLKLTLFWQDFEMLKSYNPWGKPGGGAPRVSSIKLSYCADPKNWSFQMTFSWWVLA